MIPSFLSRKHLELRCFIVKHSMYSLIATFNFRSDYIGVLFLLLFLFYHLFIFLRLLSFFTFIISIFVLLLLWFIVHLVVARMLNHLQLLAVLTFHRLQDGGLDFLQFKDTTDVASLHPSEFLQVKVPCDVVSYVFRVF